MTHKTPSPKSKAAFAKARKILVGGVNSPVRAYGAVGGTPRFIDRAKGPFLWDIDGKSYVDFVGSWGPMILGHLPPSVTRAVRKALRKGTSFGAPTEVETELAHFVQQAFPSMEMIRFVNSGTEAAMSALRLARAATNRERIVKFEGGYHGHSDGLLVSAGSGATTFGVPSSAGVPEVMARSTWVLPYNDPFSLEEIFRSQGPNIAAVILEPVAGNMGVVAPSPSFLNKLFRLTRRHGTVLIFDEVMTGFRVSYGGAQEYYGIRPDLTCLGKIIGGGFPVGAFGGRREIMEKLAPIGPVYQAGTLSGNPIAMAAGLATLRSLKTKKPYKRLDAKTADFVQFIRQEAKKRGIPLQANQVGSMFTVFFSTHPVTCYLDATDADAKRYAAFFHALLDRGVYFPPSQFEAAFVSTAHSSDVLRRAKKAASSALDVISSLL